VFSPTEVLQSTWDRYKETYVDSTYRTIDPSRRAVTTSEGQSYTMLRAVWEDDKKTFDGAWQWTQTNLARPNDHLFSWLWGQRANGTYGVLTAQSGENTASDADSDIALALIFAYARWQDPRYLDAARLIIKDIWSKEVVEIAGQPYLAADNLEKNASSPWITVNPSYISPASYELFSKVDPTDNWMALRAQSYVLLEESVALPLGATSSAGLPPDWIRVSRTTGALLPPVSSTTSVSTYDTNFGYDALRVPFRIALDWEWFRDPAALTLLGKFAFLSSAWEHSGRLASQYAHNGVTVNAAESASMYGGTIGYFMIADPKDANAVYQQKLLTLYDPGTDDWITPLSYYDANWAWFGIALYTGALPNLAQNLPQGTFSQ